MESLQMRVILTICLGTTFLSPAYSAGQFTLTKILAEGDGSIAYPGNVITNFGEAQLSNSGDIVLLEASDGIAGTNRTAIIRQRGGVDHAVALIQGSAPTPPGGTYLAFFPYAAVNDHGDVVFASSVLSNGNYHFVLADEASASSQVSSGASTDAILNSSFVCFGLNMQLNNQQSLAFLASYQNPNCTLDGYFLHTASGNATIAATGLPAPGSGGATFDRLMIHGGANERPGLNDAGELVFAANLIGGSAGAGLFHHDGSGLRAVAVEGDLIPELGIPFDLRFGVAPAINEAGDVAFTALRENGQFGGPLNSAVFLEHEGVLSTIAASGWPIPDGSGLSFHTFGSPQRTLALNDAGQLLFFAAYGPHGEYHGYFLYDIASASTCLVVADGDVVSNLPDESIWALGGPDMNTRGELLFRATMERADETKYDALILAEPMTVVSALELTLGVAEEAHGARLTWEIRSDMGLDRLSVLRQGPGQQQTELVSLYDAPASGQWLDRSASRGRSVRYQLRAEIDGVELASNVVSLEGARPNSGAEILVYPNPAARERSLRFALSRSSDITLNIFDARGRRIRRLELENLGRGENVVTWEGKDAAGRDVAPGVYHFSLHDGQRIRSGKFLVAK